LVDEEGHDCFGDQVSYILLHNRVVALDQVLDDHSLHQHSGVVLLGTSSHPVRDWRQDYLRQVRKVIALIVHDLGADVISLAFLDFIIAELLLLFERVHSAVLIDLFGYTLVTLLDLLFYHVRL